MVDILAHAEQPLFRAESLWSPESLEPEGLAVACGRGCQATPHASFSDLKAFEEVTLHAVVQCAGNAEPSSARKFRECSGNGEPSAMRSGQEFGYVMY